MTQCRNKLASGYSSGGKYKGQWANKSPEQQQMVATMHRRTGREHGQPKN
ncbi:uncharacterized protein LACBIDRAFT_307054 [Laccaria bicolor S238N-H82]|uniref:Predicted protein n=1 Tax=Laccaria bicolor (strain S238N-H82 / ATCC MYA-4686) TaxID=486041 RepID=B0DP93_LACBS|nr:uncharacterized protein LACBIDRAFT_307054 [Laccaria bicolor S238N-H82]EDR03575.1 predicted protein [Laccaria bicolor S238N-H82]|eukprot:XP_001885723.1 predicted protein [Laccaria bicolor S238N-H82]